ncbi:hypothetical protein NKF26_20000 [Haladaptatus sp. AB618]|uniref:hypothetical protein n=1 Tax=Haladaptatus sp. AB618 TaxID=2934173 RepID=UPI00209BE486|nr:hypothetical protein [Haladaptatus sp. AB618]MCO8256097.1 hypothetical protein [Haladaptatus sp. AB618]
MAVNSRAVDETTTPSRSTTPDIDLCETRPERFVFIEDGNTDGWIATDTVVSSLR